MSNFEYFKSAVMKKYATFGGRASRSEYWYFVLFSIVISIVLGMVDRIIGLGGDNGSGTIAGLYSLAVLIPSLAIGVRRLHDTGKTGWWALIGLIPILGWIVLIIFMVTDSTPGENQYGPDPKGVASIPQQPPVPPSVV